MRILLFGRPLVPFYGARGTSGHHVNAMWVTPIRARYIQNAREEQCHRDEFRYRPHLRFGDQNESGNETPGNRVVNPTWFTEANSW